MYGVYINIYYLHPFMFNNFYRLYNLNNVNKALLICRIQFITPRIFDCSYPSGEYFSGRNTSKKASFINNSYVSCRKARLEYINVSRYRVYNIVCIQLEAIFIICTSACCPLICMIFSINLV